MISTLSAPLTCLPNSHLPSQSEPPDHELEEWTTPEKGPSGRKGEYLEQVSECSGCTRTRILLLRRSALLHCFRAGCGAVGFRALDERQLA